MLKYVTAAHLSFQHVLPALPWGSKARAWFSVFDAVKARASDAGIRKVTDFCLTGSDRQSEGPGGFAVSLYTIISVQKLQFDGAAMPK